MIELVTGAMLLSSTVSLHLNTIGVATENFATNTSIETPEMEMLSLSPIPETLSEIKNNYEEEVREYYKDVPVLAEIAKCESTFRQYDSKRNVLRGMVNSQDVGLMQINEMYHLEKAKSLGYDIYTIEGNLGYALEMYKTDGTDPWSASAPCWSKKLNIAKK